jgi:hypothetical protein
MGLNGRLKMFVAAFAGFVLGALSFHTSTARAQSGSIHVTQVSVSKLAPGVLSFPNGTVIGFSCVPAMGTSDAYGTSAEGICYVGTR